MGTFIAFPVGLAVFAVGEGEGFLVFFFPDLSVVPVPSVVSVPSVVPVPSVIPVPSVEPPPFAMVGFDVTVGSRLGAAHMG